MIKIKQINNFLLLFAIACLANACYNQTTGCLDILADNFSASSDFACEDCCTYPDVELTFFSDVRPSIKVWNGNDSIFILAAGFYMQDFSFSADSETFTVTNEITFDLNNGDERTYIDDFVAFNSNTTGYTIGQHQKRDTIRSFEFSVGLPADLNDLDLDEIDSDHELDIVGNSLYNADFGYSTAFIEISTDTISTSDTILYQIPLADLNLSISLDTSFLLDYGEDLEVKLIVDVLSWTQGIDFEVNRADTTFVRSKIVENFPNSISLSN